MESYWALFVNNMVWIKPTVQDCQWELIWIKTTLNLDVKNLYQVSNPLRRPWECAWTCVYSSWLDSHVSMSTLVQMLAWEREADGGRETVAHRRKDGEADRQSARLTNPMAGWHEHTSLLYGLDEADEGWGSRLWWCELLAQVQHRNSWNNNTNHCYTSGTKPPKDHGGPAALTRVQLTRSSWRYRVSNVVNLWKTL